MPQRIRAGCDNLSAKKMDIISYLPQRIRAGCDNSRSSVSEESSDLPQRIRAGCDRHLMKDCACETDICHSAFVRVATICAHTQAATAWNLPQRIRAGCDPPQCRPARNPSHLPQRIRAGCDDIVAVYIHELGLFATAHSCGLRLRKSNAAHCEFAARR